MTDLSVLKAELPLQYVITQAGVALDPVGERLVGLCPFHDDTSPSFAVFGDALEHCGCWSCDFQMGDVIDFIRRKWDLDFGASLEVAEAFLVEWRAEDNWAPLVVEKGEKVDPEVLRRRASDAWEAGSSGDVLGTWLVEKELGEIDWRWLRAEWGVGVEFEQLVIPHMAGSGGVTGLKTRSGLNHPYAAGGSRFPYLYGAWRDKGRNRVLLCEGESDTWWVSWIFREEAVDVLGLPVGVGSGVREEWKDRLSGREVTLLFDGDTPGRTGSRKWVSELMGVCSSVGVGVMPDGYDCGSISEGDVRQVVRGRVVMDGWQREVAEVGNTLVRVNSSTVISDWVFVPEKYLVFEGDGFGFEGHFKGERVGSGRKKKTLLSRDMITESGMTQWANRNEKVWLGTKRDAQHILKNLSLEKAFLPRGIGTFQVGWHGGTFVLPSGKLIGDSDLVYVEGHVTSTFEQICTLERVHRAPDPRVLLTRCLDLHDPQVVRVILGWIAASCLRVEFREFPVLAVVGGSKGGKTTLLDTLLGVFGYGGGEMNLRSSTPYALGAICSGSVGIPVWIDEYRRGARRDTREAMEQLVRDAWTASSAARGGVSTQVSRVFRMPASAPLVISGEDMFSETSLMERVVMVRVPKDDSVKGGGLMEVRGMGSLGLDWLEWVVASYRSGQMHLPVYGGEGRVKWGRAVVEWGWELLGRWLEWDLGGLDWEGVAGSGVDAGDPVVELLLWGLDELDGAGRPLVWVEEGSGQVWVRTLELVREGERSGLELAGGSRSVAEWIRETFGGGEAKRSKFGRGLLLPQGSAGVLEKMLG